ncbi:MAG: phage holin family protein [Solirubrobacteraceae bacterium]
MSSPPGGPTDQSSAGSARQQGIAAAITEVSERASVLIREEIELAKTEITEKTTRLAKGAVVAVVAGVFFFTALFFVLIGCAWLLYYELPIGNEFTYFWGFFAMAVILVVLGVIAGLLAAKAVKSGSPPVPTMAIEEAQKIRETVSSSSSSPDRSASAAMPPTPTTPAAPVPPVASPLPATPSSPVGSGDVPDAKTDGGLGRGTVDGTTLGS